jgi:hypothetical protein
MANSTFSGPVRSEGGFEQITVAASTGVVTTNLDISSAGAITTSSTINAKQVVDTTFNASAAATGTLTAAQSGTLFLIDGTNNNVITLPTVSTDNVGVHYEFLLTVAVASGKTTTIVLPGSAVSAFQAMLSLVAGTAANAVSDVAGDTLTLVAATVLNARVSMTCVSDDGTNSKWMTTALSTPIATVA